MVVKALRYSWTVPGSIPGGVTGDFFRGSLQRNHVPWGRLSPWKWVPGISAGVKAAGAYGWQPTALVMPNVKKIRGLNLSGTPWACSGLLRDDLYLTLYLTSALDGVGGVCFTSGKEIRYPLYRRPVWKGTKNLVPTGVRTTDRPGCSESLCCLCHTDRQKL